LDRIIDETRRANMLTGMLRSAQTRMSTKRKAEECASSVVDNDLMRAAAKQGRPFAMPAKRRRMVDGTAKLDRMMRLLASSKVDNQPRNVNQVNLHVGMVGAVLTGMFRDSPEAEMKTAMKRHNLPSSNQLYAAIAPRRFGKSKAVAMFAAAYAIACPGTTTSIFSTAKRASELLLDEIRHYIESVPNGGFKIIKSNTETLVLQDGRKQTKVSSYPGRADT
jgi:hypothetical protein